MRRGHLAATAGALLGIIGPLATASGQMPGPAPGDAIHSNANADTTGGNAKALAGLAQQTAEDQAVSRIKPLVSQWLGIGDGAPDWMKRIEIQGDFLQRGKPQQSILTVQPLFQSAGKQDTVFVQGSIFHYAMFGEYRWTGNFGLGYRRLLADNSILLGANAFYDDEFTYNHRRMSAGAEAKWGPLDLGFNDYVALTHDRTVAPNTFERALSGRDVTLSSQVPFIPWIKVSGSYYAWDRYLAPSDTNGMSYAVELFGLPYLSVKFTHSHSDFSDDQSRPQNILSVQFKLATWGSQSTLATGPIISDRIFETRDLTKDTLDKVERENRIIVERRANTSGATVIISRLN
ncbi:MAG TPA: inverse autotransporter beta domain-containing protein [Stellaceae bacterium]|nr:inverse autotransporter beta domain-containing protein [Stellaceae bacterium]